MHPIDTTLALALTVAALAGLATPAAEAQTLTATLDFATADTIRDRCLAHAGRAGVTVAVAVSVSVGVAVGVGVAEAEAVAVAVAVEEATGVTVAVESPPSPAQPAETSMAATIATVHAPFPRTFGNDSNPPVKCSSVIRSLTSRAIDCQSSRGGSRLTLIVPRCNSRPVQGCRLAARRPSIRLQNHAYRIRIPILANAGTVRGIQMVAAHRFDAANPRLKFEIVLEQLRVFRADGQQHVHRCVRHIVAEIPRSDGGGEMAQT